MRPIDHRVTNLEPGVCASSDECDYSYRTDWWDLSHVSCFIVRTGTHQRQHQLNFKCLHKYNKSQMVTYSSDAVAVIV